MYPMLHMLNICDSMREGTNERTNERMYTTTKHITTLLLRSRVKKILRRIYPKTGERSFKTIFGMSFPVLKKVIFYFVARHPFLLGIGRESRKILRLLTKNC